jgi:hypothetical protein
MKHTLVLTMLTCLWYSEAHAWTYAYNFEGPAVGSQCFPDASGSSLVTTERAFGGSKGCKMTIRQGEGGFGEFGGVIDFPDLRRGEEIWIRVRTYMPTGFDYNSYGEGNHLKFLRIRTASASGAHEGYADVYIDRAGSGAPFKYIFELEGNWSYMGSQSNAIRFDQWETYEYYIRFGDTFTSSGGTSLIRYWKNGTLMAEIPNRKSLNSATSVATYFYFFTYWNGGAPRTQSMFADDVIITNERPANRDASGNPFIGMGTTPAPPAAPTSLRVSP